MALVANRTTWKQLTPFRHLALLACAALAVGPIVAGTSHLAVAAEPATSDNMASDVAVEPTVTDVPFVEGSVDAGYVLQGEVPEQVGDAQQREAVASEVEEDLDSRLSRAIGGTVDANIARVDLESDNVVVAVTWDLNAEAPESIWLRFLEDATWSEWTELESDSMDESDVTETRSGTEAFSLFNADAVEVVALGQDDTLIPGLSVVIIEADNEGDLVNTLEPGDEAATDSTSETEPSEETVLSEDAELNRGGADEPSADEDAVSDVVLDNEGLVETDNASTAGALLLPSDTVAAIPAALDSTGTVYSTGFNGLNIKTRKAWGAPTPSGSPSYMTVKGAVIHHTLSTDNYTQDQVAQQIRNINSYHAYTLGWGDIGYNLVVDKFGGVWEGRAGGLTSGILGAHATGANWDTFGITYLGGYQGGSPSAAVRDVFAKTIAWKFMVHGVTNAAGYASIKHGDGKWYSTPVISGHRDVGSTTCPGDVFYSQIPSVRTAAATYLQTSAFQGSMTRLGGADRYATNRAVNAASSVTGKPVFVVTGTEYADALTASPAAASLGGYLFLVPPTGLDQVTSSAIVAKKPSAIYIVGGASVVSDATASQLKSATGKTPVRIAGNNRYETSAAILERFFGTGNYSKVFVATGIDFPDALTAAAAAGALKAPVVLVQGINGTLPGNAKTVLNKGTKGKTLLAVGGTGVITPTVLSGLQSQVSGSKTARLSGSNRYATNIAVNDYVAANGGGTAKRIWVANGNGFADALSAATSAGAQGQRLTLSPGYCLPSPVVSKWISASSSAVNSVVLVGSTGVLSDSVANLAECG